MPSPATPCKCQCGLGGGLSVQGENKMGWQLKEKRDLNGAWGI